MEKRPGQNGGARASMGQGRRAAEAPKSSVPSESFIVGGEYGFAVAEGGHSLEAGPGCTSPRSASGAGGAGKAAGPPGPGCPPVAGARWGPPAPTHVQKVSFPHVTPVSPARLPGPSDHLGSSSSLGFTSRDFGMLSTFPEPQLAHLLRSINSACFMR